MPPAREAGKGKTFALAGLLPTSPSLWCPNPHLWFGLSEGLGQVQCRLAGSRPAAGAGAAAVTTDQKGPQAVRPKARMPSIVLPLSEETFGPLSQTDTSFSGLSRPRVDTGHLGQGERCMV